MKNEYYEILRGEVDSALELVLTESKADYGVLFDAMRYSVLGGGKRLRGVLMLEFGRLCGISHEQMIPFACAIEMIHASTLIHDDLPCMDNDDFRRGKPACHVKYGDDIALLAGDALYSFALEKLMFALSSQDFIGDKLCALAVFTGLCGANGVFAGQILDKKYENSRCTLDELLQLHALKTGALFNACARIPCILSATDVTLEKVLRVYISKVGLAFQIKDDLLDIEGNFDKLGKATGADADKSTFVSVLGLEESKRYLTNLLAEAREVVASLPDCELLLWICDFIERRDM